MEGSLEAVSQPPGASAAVGVYRTVFLSYASADAEVANQVCQALEAQGVLCWMAPRDVKPGAQYADAIVRAINEAKAVVRAAKFAPLGERSNAGGLPHLHFRSFPAAEAYAALNDATMIIVQCESAAALDKAEEIVAVDGIDMVLVGLNDLLADWGIPGEYDHPKVRAAYAATIAACRKHGKHCGVGGLASRPDLAAEFVKMGARYVSTGTDLAFLLGACTARAKQVHEIKL